MRMLQIPCVMKSGYQKEKMLFLILSFGAFSVSLYYSIPSYAQTPNAQIEVENASKPQPAPAAGERLSEWLLKRQQRPIGNTGESMPYALGTIWNSAAEIQPQSEQKQQLLKTLAQLRAPSDDPSFEKSRAALTALIEKMPVTGRVVLPSASARY